MRLYRTKMRLLEMQRTSMQGWIEAPQLAVSLNEGWKIRGVCSPHSHQIQIILTRRVWFWQRSAEKT